MEKQLRRRFAAFVIDGLLLSIAAFLVTLATAFLGPLAWLGDLVIAALPFAYFTGLESGSRSASLGKRLLRLRVTRGDGKPLDWRRSVARFGVLGAPGLFAGAAGLAGDRLFSYLPPDHVLRILCLSLTIALAGCVWTSFFLDEHDRGLHDTLTDSHVIPTVAPEEETEIFAAQKPWIALGIGIAAGVIAVPVLYVLFKAGAPPDELRTAFESKVPSLIADLRQANDGRRVWVTLTKTEDEGWMVTAEVATDLGELKSDERLAPRVEKLFAVAKTHLEPIEGIDEVGVFFHAGHVERQFARSLRETDEGDRDLASPDGETSENQ